MLNFQIPGYEPECLTASRWSFPPYSAEEFYNLTLSNCLEEMETPASRGNTSPKIMVDKVAQTEKTAFRNIFTSGTQDREEAKTSPIDVKAL